MKMSSRYKSAFIIIFFTACVFAVNYHAGDALADNFDHSSEPKAWEWRNTPGINGGTARKPAVMIIKDQNTWQNIYRSMKKGRSKIEIPVIDFSRYMLVAIFMGRRGSTGYYTNILTAEERDGLEVMELNSNEKVRTLTMIKQKIFMVEYEEVTPGGGVGWSETTPYHIALVSKSVYRFDLSNR